MHQRRVAARDDRPVRQLDRGADERSLVALARCALRLAGSLARRLDRGPVLRAHDVLFHQRLEALAGLLLGMPRDELAAMPEVAPQDLLPGGTLRAIVVDDREARSVDAHVRRGLVHRARARDALEDALEQRERRDVAVVVHRGLAVRLEVERVDHVDVEQVGRGRLVRRVDRVLEREAPDWEGLELRVTRVDAALVLVVDLRETGRHLAAVRAGCVDDDERPLRLDVGVRAVAFLADDLVDVGRVAVDRAVRVDRDAAPLELRAERRRGRLPRVARDHHRAHEEPPPAEVVDELEGVRVVGQPEVRADLAALDVAGVDADDDLRLVAELLEQVHLDVGVEARQHARRVLVEEQLPAELEIELVATALDPLEDRLGLFFEVLRVVECRAAALHRASSRSPPGEGPRRRLHTTGMLRRGHCRMGPSPRAFANFHSTPT